MPLAHSWIAILARDPRRAKSRLAPLLPPRERALLARAMLGDVLVAARAAVDGRVLVVTESDEVRELAARHGAEVLHVSARGMRAAARAAARYLAASGCPALLLLPADVPFVSARELRRVLAAARSAAVVVVPDRRRSGTNALALRPPLVFAPLFGERSFPRHIEAARSGGLRWRAFSSPALAVDIDDVRDLRYLYRWRRRAGARTARLVDQLVSSSSPNLAGEDKYVRRKGRVPFPQARGTDPPDVESETRARSAPSS